MALAEAMGVGRGVVTLIGLVELSAPVLILIPRRHLLGASSATLTMAGALVALVVLAAATFVIFGRRARD